MITKDYKKVEDTACDYDYMQSTGQYEPGKVPKFEAWDWFILKTMIIQFLWRNPGQEKVKIVDVGCGPGHDMVIFKDYLREQNFSGKIEMVGCDISNEMVKSAREKGLDVVQCDYREKEFIEKHNGADIVWSDLSLIHLPLNEVEDSFKLFFDLAKPGGLVGIGLKSGNDETKMEEKNRGDSSADYSRLTTYYSEGRIRELFEKNGCSIIYFVNLPHKSGKYYDYFWVFGIRV
jgi:SAM-dependent methyltransferase